MKIIFIIVALVVVGAFVYFGVKQYKTPAVSPTADSGQASMQPQTPEAEGERITNPEGLITQDITFGDGETAESGDKITVHYIGTLKDGTVFDASTSRGEPFVFVLGKGEVIEGWDIGVQGMKEGGVRELVIPADLAYGNNAVGAIPAGSDLSFLVQLLQVEKQ